MAVTSFRPNIPGLKGVTNVTIGWGDGATSDGSTYPDSGGGFRVLGSYTYSQPAMYPISVSIVDSIYTLHATAGTTAEVRPAQDGETSPSKANLTTYNPSIGE